MRYLALSWNGQLYISVLMGAIFVVCYLATWRPWVYMASSLIVTDRHLDQRTQSSIQELVKSFFSQASGHKTAKNILDFLSAQYAFVKRVRIFYKSAQQAVVKIDADLPLVQVIPAYIITQAGVATRAEQFVPHAYEHLFCIHLDNAVSLENEYPYIYAFAKKVPALIQEQYSCTWFNKMHIVLQDKQDPLLTVNIDTQTLITYKLARALERVKKLLKSAEYGKQLKRGFKWCIDTRCKDQLIVAQCRG